MLPLQENAAIYSFTAKIDDRTITAVVKEKQTAEEEYNEAISQGRTGVMMRQSAETFDTFTVNHRLRSENFAERLPVDVGECRCFATRKRMSNHHSIRHRIAMGRNELHSVCCSDDDRSTAQSIVGSSAIT